MDAKAFFYAFGKVLYRIDAAYDDFAKRADAVSATHLWILYALNDGNEHTQREICEDWALPKSTVNHITTELKRSGYVVLKPIKGKRREMTVELTESGKAYAEALLRDVYQKENDVFEALCGEGEAIVDALNRIAVLLRN